MTTKVQKWGNSLAVRIPKEVSEGFRAGTPVELQREGDALLLRPMTKKKYILSELVSGITAKNRHKEFDWGKPRGKEIW